MPTAPADQPLANWDWQRLCDIGFRYAKRLTGNEHDALDVVQSAALSIFKKAANGTLEPVHTSEGYFYRAVVNEVADMGRRNSRRKPCVPLADEHAAAIPAPPTRVEEIPMEQEDLQRIWQILREEEKTLLKMKYWGNCTLKEIGQHFGIKESAASQRVKRLLKKLRLFFDLDDSGIVLTPVARRLLRSIMPAHV